MRKYLILACTIILLGSCSNDQDAFIDNSLEGTWELVNISCFCFFEPDIDFTATKITFAVDDKTLTVTQADDNSLFKEAGQYTYEGEKNEIRLSANESYTYLIEELTLRLVFVDNPNIADDEVSYEFRRP
ncbi:lipocalin family protein [Maribacter sp. 2210JD10-5]|uniref:lipocalin family protein n=1 Tax=Maribacter sp. 2210JD10-5 TaxID=3386272 RepID=UPI0039BD1F86